MPSANHKIEKQASTEAADPIRQVFVAIEHKIRNLEKRKVKLESYQDLQKNGKELLAEQKTAVAKYDEVVQKLDCSREIHKTILGITNEAAKQQKKLARKEAAERLQQDIAKVREVLVIQDTLTNMGSDSAREDFLAGTNGAVKLSEEDLKYLDDFYVELTTKSQKSEGEVSGASNYMQKVAEHYIAIIEGKQREVAGTTYGKIKEIVGSITQSGYFDQTSKDDETAPNQVTETIPEGTTDATIQEQSNEEQSGDVHIPSSEKKMPMPPNFPVRVASLPVVSCAAPVSTQMPVVPQAVQHPSAPVDPTYYANATSGFIPPQQQNQQVSRASQPPPRINDVIGKEDFFFLQESEIESAEMIPQAQQQKNPIVSHIPPTVNAPIPTQTYTNQNFAGAPVVTPQVIYPQEMSHLSGFTGPNPPPPIPMPPSHQPNMQFSPQHPAGFQQEQGFSQMPQQHFEPVSHRPEGDAQKDNNEPNQKDNSGQTDMNQGNEVVTDWNVDTEPVVPITDWNQPDDAQQSQDSNSQGQQNWGEQRSGYRGGRGGRRGNSNGYGGNRPRTGGYQQNGRSNSQGNYFRSDNSTYQNGYHSRNNWSNNGGGSSGNAGVGNSNTGSGYGSGYKRQGSGTGTGGSRGGPGGPRGGERSGERNENRGGQYRSGQQQQKSGSRGGFSGRPKTQTTQQ